ncbi:MAG: methionyl-tRNA formyltransferase [Bacilli bacterium]
MDKKDIRIVFMGTPEISAKTLESMILDGFNIVGVIAQMDKPVGRKKILEKVPTKVIAEKYSIPVFQPYKIRKDFEFLKQLNPDLILTLAYGQILSQEVLDIPKYGCLNLHGSLLPKYRGASPIQSALIHNEKITGVTLMEMIKAMDAGKMYAKKVVEIDENDNSTSLFSKIQVACFELVKESLLDVINNKIKGVEQDENDATYCSLITKEEEKLDLTKSKKELIGWIRGLSYEPGAYLFLDGVKIKILKAKIVNEIVSDEIGTIIKSDKNGLIFQAINGQIAILELQKEGKKIMDYKSFINGNQNLIGKSFN